MSCLNILFHRLKKKKLEIFLIICFLETDDDQKTKIQDTHPEQKNDTVQDIYATVNKNKQHVYGNIEK